MSGVDRASTVRLFTALWPDATLRARFAAERDRWTWSPGARPVATASLHVTLHFIGAVARDRMDEARAALAMPFEPFRLVFTEHRSWTGGIAVCEPATVPPALSALHASLGSALDRLARPRESRPYRPHVTMARAAGQSHPPSTMEPIAWNVDRHVLVESRGGRYDVLASCPAVRRPD